MAHFVRILHPTDFSENGRAAIPVLEELCSTSAVEGGPEVHVLHVLEPMISTTDFTWAGLSHQELDQRRREASQEAMDALIESLDLRATVVSGSVVRGKSHEAIDAYAQEHGIDLIVMATHGHTGLSHLLLGSTAELVVRTAQCPVLTVKAKPNEAQP